MTQQPRLKNYIFVNNKYSSQQVKQCQFENKLEQKTSANSTKKYQKVQCLAV